jgi:hypothetical protein
VGESKEAGGQVKSKASAGIAGILNFKIHGSCCHVQLDLRGCDCVQHLEMKM